MLLLTAECSRAATIVNEILLMMLPKSYSQATFFLFLCLNPPPRHPLFNLTQREVRLLRGQRVN